jgi:ABC-type lipoprotein release transport system permease subunit
MSIQELRSVETGISRGFELSQLQRWFLYVVCAITGMIGGAIGIALAIGLMIAVVQVFDIVFEPNSYLLMGIAVLFGLGISWLLERVARTFLSVLNSSPRHQQVIFVFAVLIILLESIVFMP